MGRPPAYIFVVRHGKRLDAADKQWHLSSPTPYDPPLTYGGWIQSKTVGTRIASILHEREARDEAAARADPNSPPTRHSKKRGYKVVIHSSPFLRCVQTSVAIAAGLATNPPPSPPGERSPSPRAIQPSPLNPSPSRSHPVNHTHTNVPHNLPESSIAKSVLRLDPFLGEWLSPDYFEHITPPSKSSLMLATAKAELLRRENYHDYPHFQARHHHTPGASSQLWSASPNRGCPVAHSRSPESDAAFGLDSLSALKGGLPRLRSDSTGHIDHRALRSVSSPDPTSIPGYVSPTPSYALSTSEPIPTGYVAHARDACVDVDYQWDSSRDNLGWGDGGELPEEWAAMHQRFRKGLRRLIEWYSTTENPGEMVTKTVSRLQSAQTTQQESDRGCLPAEEADVEEVVILVSHGAGCNALIGAITQQPVLIDVGMSSITMAQRKPEFDYEVNVRVTEKPASSLEEALLSERPMMSDMFEIVLFANTDHLHSAVTPPSLGPPSSTSRNPRSWQANGFGAALNETNLGSSLYGSSSPGSRSNSVNASLGSMRRVPQGPSSSALLSSPNIMGFGGTSPDGGIANSSPAQSNHSSSSGLWTPKYEDNIPEKQATTLPALNINQEKELRKKDDGHLPRIWQSETRPVEPEPSTPARNNNTVEPPVQTPRSEEHDQFDEDAAPRLWASKGTGSPWGTPRPPGEAERLRDFSSTKRRWTVNER
ncbi:hypothetical protein GGS23DRAFT_125365 [Durotheca rogersii]|uniref:uncharacterized protein n=1 Tax=Durotheca rogersii TaxID=419775 RepID=UPI0022208F14|nr:uncharacterized protein GGS23DRAFT_125365 [Durotheca rogersii]KAI5862054.1 hypothetical protein GGS23DRAFT_125365 [Durotheca rogersii]